MSRAWPLWAIKSPDGEIIQESVVYFGDKLLAWEFAYGNNNKTYRKVEKATRGDDYRDLKEIMADLGYKLVRVIATEAEK